MDILNQRFRTSSLNLFFHVSSICFMAIEAVGIRNTPSSLLCDACHPYNIANSLQQKSLWILGIIGMCLNILWGGPCSLALLFNYAYLPCPHFGYISMSTYSPLYRILSLGHAWYDMYSTSNIFNISFASLQLSGKTLSFRSTLSLNNL